ncbi:thiopeptide-type bacteriocin biosynthesis protein [Streptomyces sp. CA2R101]|uniref:thiopeptide-type bacteriocin biosynthesis protein n=1 Tax=Streptomyces sp. CA2R101 TaxID=3120152 RepID=UPI003008CB16
MADDVPIKVGTAQIPLTEFLRRCTHTLDGGSDAQADPELKAARDTFLGAGISALRLAAPEATWLQYGLEPRPERMGDLYAAIDATARELLQEEKADGFFFMHKPPGLRVRFETAGSRRSRLDSLLEDRVRSWNSEGLIAAWCRGVYESESYLFGGPDSMRSVHRVFAADSLAWLGYHQLARKPVVDGPPGPCWAMSLVLIRSLCDALEIVGWEDLDVWDRVRRQTWRQLAADTSGNEEFARLTRCLRQGWDNPDELTALLSPGARTLVDEYRRSIAREGARWLADYFMAPQAAVGPREAAAYAIVFHWNRGCFPLARQSLITEALAARPPVGPP